MSVAVQIRDVPEEVRDRLAERAAAAGKSLQGYLHDVLVNLAAQPTRADFDRLAHLRRPMDAERVVATVREGREERDETGLA